MPRNGSGTYELPLPNVVDGTAIEASWANTTLADLATAITNSIAKDGETVWTGADDHNGNEIILDVDGDTSITADTDDRIDFKIGGLDVLQMTATGGANLQHLANGQAGLLFQSYTLVNENIENIGKLAGGFNRYEVDLINLTLDADGYIFLRFSDNGPAGHDGGTNYDYAITENGGAAASLSSTTSIPLSPNQVGGAANEYGMNVKLIFEDPTATGKWKSVTWTGGYRNASGSLVTVQGYAEWKNTADIEYIGLYASSSATAFVSGANFASGLMRTYNFR